MIRWRSRRLNEFDHAGNPAARGDYLDREPRVALFCEKTGHFRELLEWHAICSTVGIVKSVRTTLPSIWLVLSILGMATAPAFAFAGHPICTAKHHQCGETASISKCCCGDAQSSQADSTPSQSRVEVRANFTAVPVGVDVLELVTPIHGLVTVHTSAPHQYLVDLPTLFASLLI